MLTSIAAKIVAIGKYHLQILIAATQKLAAGEETGGKPLWH
ncbi:hypothetical protein QUA32_24890 [Microcoleus sp. Pol14D6]